MSNWTWPTLYRKNANGAILIWNIRVSKEGSTIVTEWGQEGGKIQQTRDHIKEGKNEGRSNATSPHQQAMLEAQSQWEKQLKRQYVKTREAAVAGESSELVQGGLLPMLAHDSSKHQSKVVFPCYLQPKLDGHRCIGLPDGSLWSRTRARINSMPHIEKAIRQLNPNGFALDGELYNHDLHDQFEELTGLIRCQQPAKGHTLLQYHVYDAIIPGLSYRERLAVLTELFDREKVPVCLRLVKTVVAGDWSTIDQWHDTWVAEGYEGAIIRRPQGLYKAGRQHDLLKVKKFNDAEFVVTGVYRGRGKLAQCGIFSCVTATGEPFDVKMKGPLDELEKYARHPRRYTGRKLTVQFQGLTSAGIPRFPIGLRWWRSVDAGNS